MRRAILNASLLLFAVCAHAAEEAYPSDVIKWQEVVVPREADAGARAVWSYAANYSQHEWRVFAQDGKPHAQLSSEGLAKPIERPSFTPKVKDFHGASTFIAVEDGWLVGFNEGEFGAALHWFNHDGERSYKISDHQVVDFFLLSNGIHAIEGLAHLGMSRGSVIRIVWTEEKARWQATSVVKLPFAPYVASLNGDAMLITLSDSLVSVGSDRKVETLLSNVPWGGLYPNSSILTLNKQKLYIGMRQFVGEFDLKTKKLRLLIPSAQFLHKLPKEDEERIRKQFSS